MRISLTTGWVALVPIALLLCLVPAGPSAAAPPTFSSLAGSPFAAPDAWGSGSAQGRFRTFSTAASPPVNNSAPSLAGVATVGQTLTCGVGQWTGAAAFAFAWLRDAAAIPGASGSSYVLTAQDSGHALQCQVTASGGGGSTVALSAPVTTGAVPAPGLLDAPVIAGPAVQGGRLRCRAGGWIDADSFVFDWLRDGDRVAGGTAYSPVRADVRRALQCRVTATGPGGSAVATSDPLVIGARDCVVPKLAGLALSRAGRKLKAAGCRLGEVRRSPSAKVRRGRVISSTLRSGARRAPATKVGLRVSSGPRS